MWHSMRYERFFVAEAIGKVVRNGPKKLPLQRALIRNLRWSRQIAAMITRVELFLKIYLNRHVVLTCWQS